MHEHIRAFATTSYIGCLSRGDVSTYCHLISGLISCPIFIICDVMLCMSLLAIHAGGVYRKQLTPTTHGPVTYEMNSGMETAVRAGTHEIHGLSGCATWFSASLTS